MNFRILQNLCKTATLKKTNYSLMQVKSIKGEHSVILSTFIKLPFVIKIFVLSAFERPFYTGFLYMIKPLYTPERGSFANSEFPDLVLVPFHLMAQNLLYFRNYPVTKFTSKQ